jgi:ApbE superfamily uncharacterized protein (UPF0280 family)
VTAVRAWLPDGRLHLQHGPMDLLVAVEGDAAAVAAAHAEAWARFAPLLDALVAELPVLRRPVADGPCPLRGAVAAAMWHACAPLRAHGYLTPMAAVAGAVAQEIVACYRRPGIARAWVNNGGDIALHLAPGASVRVGLYADLGRFDPAEALADGGLRTDARFAVRAAQPVRGVATSGWRGRSFSRGIADSVTVLARTAAEADAAATVIANAVDADDPRILRRPACELRDDSDLGDLPVTVDVPALGADAADAALRAGLRMARRLQAAGRIHAAALACQGRLARLPPEAGAADAPVAPASGGRDDPAAGAALRLDPAHGMRSASEAPYGAPRTAGGPRHPADASSIGSVFA